MIRILLR